jgi:hypothetical protein
MASANFNTQIVSSSNDEILEYNLDEVITKDFLGNPGYNYTLNRNVPAPIGVTIENMDLGSYLIIPGLLDFELSIIVSDNDRVSPIQVTATTIVTIDGRKKSFTKEITKFFESENYKQKKEETIENWSSIISNRISPEIGLVEGPVRP